jgi:hypothetical protein
MDASGPYSYTPAREDGDSRPANIPFYVDVLCMPKQPTNGAAAINQLKHIYSKAPAVLVWDKNLLERPKTGEYAR